MNNYDFKFADSYLGYWNIPNIGRKIPGTLYLEKHSIRLELFWNNIAHTNFRTLSTATGYAYTENNKKKCCYYFKLKDLHLTYVSWFGKRQSQYKFDVYSFFISDKPRFSINGILNCCIRTSLMDKWLWDYTRDCYECPLPIDENDPIELKFEVKPSLTLYESSKFWVYIKFGNSMNTPNDTGFIMSANCFLNIYLKKKKIFYDALDLTECIIWLFSLLWNNNFNPDFLEFRTSKAKFLYKQSDRYSYKYRNIESTTLNTLISDFEESDFSPMIDKWLRLVTDYKNAISTFFETQFNEHTTPSSAIKNYVSVIDGLSRDFDIPSDGKTNNTKKKEKFEPVFNIIKHALTAKEFNELKMAVLRESTKDIKCRFTYFIKLLSEYVLISLEQDFCSKTIETRNLITHSKANSNDVFNKEQYRDVVFCLEDLIRAYILKNIGVPQDIAKKIISKIEMTSQ